jgi:hypothetical protein
MSKGVEERKARWEVETYRAYALKNGDRVLEISDRKDGDDELDIGVVTDTVDRIEPTGLTECIFLRRTLEGTWFTSLGRVEAYINSLDVDRVLRPSPAPCPSWCTDLCA